MTKTWYYHVLKKHGIFVLFNTSVISFSFMKTKYPILIIPCPLTPTAPPHLDSGRPLSIPLSHSALVIHQEPDPLTKYTSKCWMNLYWNFPVGWKPPPDTYSHH